MKEQRDYVVETVRCPSCKVKQTHFTLIDKGLQNARYKCMVTFCKYKWSRAEMEDFGEYTTHEPVLLGNQKPVIIKKDGQPE